MAETKKDRSRSTGLATPSSSPGAVPFGLAPQLPLTFDKRDGITNIKDYEKLAIQNLKMLILTIPGERIMDPRFGVGLKTFLFKMNHPSTHAEIRTRVYKQVNRYLPFIKIEEIQFRGGGPEEDPFDSNLLHMSVMFTIVPLQLSSMLDLSVEAN